MYAPTVNANSVKMRDPVDMFGFNKSVLLKSSLSHDRNGLQASRLRSDGERARAPREFCYCNHPRVCDSMRNQMNASTKILLLGIGRWGANHLRVLHSLPIDFYVAELDAKRLESARAMGIDASHLSTNYKDFAGKVDAAIVVTPAQTHFPLCKEFLNAGKDVFVEKPITLIHQEAKELAELADRTKRILQVGHIFRFDPASQWLRDAIQQGKFGKLKILRGNFSGFKRQIGRAHV